MSAGIVIVEDVIRYIADQYTKHKMLVPYWLKVGDVPRADAVEVVRYGECKHMTPDGRCDKFADDNIKPSVSDSAHAENAERVVSDD